MVRLNRQRPESADCRASCSWMPVSFCHSMTLLASAAAATTPSNKWVMPTPVRRAQGGGRCYHRLSGAVQWRQQGLWKIVGGAELMRPILSRPPRPQGLDGIHAPRQSRRRGPPGNTGWVASARAVCQWCCGNASTRWATASGAAEQPQGSVVGCLAGEGQIIR